MYDTVLQLNSCRSGSATGKCYYRRNGRQTGVKMERKIYAPATRGVPQRKTWRVLAHATPRVWKGESEFPPPKHGDGIPRSPKTLFKPETTGNPGNVWDDDEERPRRSAAALRPPFRATPSLSCDSPPIQKRNKQLQAFRLAISAPLPPRRATREEGPAGTRKRKRPSFP